MAIAINGNGTVTGISVGGLPDGIVDTDMLAATAVTDAKIANTTISEGKLSASVNTITEADEWRVTTGFTTDDANPIGANWERNDTSFDKIGTGMTESSGIFAFPCTGIWQVEFQGYCYQTASLRRYLGWDIYRTGNNGTNWSVRSSSYSHIGYSSTDGTYSNAYLSTMLDIYDISNHKIKFRVHTNGDVIYSGDSAANCIAARFIRLGDT